MRFLVDASLPRSTAGLIRSYGHEAMDVRDIGLGTAEDSDIAAFARAQGFAIITADLDFGDIRQYPPGQYHGVVVVERPANATVSLVLRLVAGLFQRPQLLAQLPGRLAVVDAWRIRLR